MIKLIVSEKVRGRMKQALRRAGLREIGGIIMGQEIASGQFLVVDFSLDETSGERAHFVRDANHHRQALETFFDLTGHNYKEFNYLGEWHSHPSFPIEPSLTDLRSMQALVDGERGIEFAVLLIVKLGFFGRLITSARLHQHGHVPALVNLTTN